MRIASKSPKLMLISTSKSRPTASITLSLLTWPDGTSTLLPSPLKKLLRKCFYRWKIVFLKSDSEVCKT